MTTGIVYWYFAPGVLGSPSRPIALPPGLVPRHVGDNVHAEIAGAAFMHFRAMRPELTPPSGLTIALRDGDYWRCYLVTPNEAGDGTWIVEATFTFTH